MNRYGKSGAAVTDISGRPGVTGHGSDRVMIVRGKDRRRRERSGIENEQALQLREDAADVREDAADVREDAADVREGAANVREGAANVREGAANVREGNANVREGNATSREDIIRTAETNQTKSDTQMSMLQQANASLVAATIEAQRLTEQIQATQAELERAKLAAEKANRAKSEFLSSMSHELRSPLNAILGFAQLMETSTPSPTDVQTARLQQIIKAGWYLLELINEILDLAVIESGKIPLVLAPVCLADIMDECKVIIETQAQSHGIQINYLPFDKSWSVTADRTRVKQILINLLSNAVKYNREHGTVEVACTAGTPGRIRISIKDSGTGLPPEMLQNLFQPFNRLGQEYGSVEGTGIGLVTAKQLTELMDGTLGVESTYGVGSEFWIELTQSGVSQSVNAPTLPAKTAPRAHQTETLNTLLYVEDNPANLLLVEQIIAEHTHMRMLSAYDGHFGLHLARVQRPDVILMDIGLPDMSGIEALNILRNDPATAHIPVIALSANAMTSDIQKGLGVGFFHYLTKPIKVNEFMNVLDDALKFVETSRIYANGSVNKIGTP